MKKIKTALLTLSFLLTLTGSALADNGVPLSTTTTNITQTVTAPTVDIIDVNIITGKLSAVDLTNKKLTLNSKENSKTFTYDTKTIFEYNNEAITVDKIPLGSKLTVKSITLGDKTERVIKVQVNEMLQYQYPGFVSVLDFTNKKITVNKTKTESFAFSYDNTTVFEYKKLTITPENIPLGSKVIVKYVLLADNTVKVTKFEVVALNENRFEGGLTVVDATNKKITINNSKYEAKTFTYDDKTIFEYKGLPIKPEQLVLGSKVIVTFSTLANGSNNLIKVQIVDVTPKADNKKEKDNDDKKKDKKKDNKNSNKKGKSNEKSKSKGNEKSKNKGHNRK